MTDNALLPARTTEAPPGGAWIELVRPAADLARMIAATEFVPEPMRNNPATITAAILFGAELGIGPMQSLAKIDVVKGRPAPRAELARALALAAGHELWVEESTNTRVKVCGRRRGSEHVQTVTWTTDDVKRAGISSNNYARYPRQMLLARASAELVRMMCPEVLGGISAVAEEAGDEPDPDNVVAIDTGTTAPRKARRARGAPYVAPLPTDAAETPTAPDPDPVDAQPGRGDLSTIPGFGGKTDDAPTDAQRRKLMASMRDAGLVEREDRLQFTRAVLGRDVTTSNELTRDETSRVIDALQAWDDGRATAKVSEDGTWTFTTTADDAVTLPGDEWGDDE